MTLSIVLQFIVVLAAIWMGARFSGVGLGLWGAVGLLVLVAVFGVNPTSDSLMAFSIAPRTPRSQGWMTIWWASGTLIDASWLSGVWAP